MCIRDSFTSLTPSQQDEFYSDYMSSRLSGEIDAYGNPIGGGNDDKIILPQTMMAQAPSIMDQEPEQEDSEGEGLFRRFRAEGGIMNTDVVGGEFDFESARQMYGLGKLVKKVTRSVKKIAKSPIGKAALIGVAGFGIPGTSFGGLFGRASFGNAARGLLGQEGIKATLFGLPSGNLTAPITKGLIGEGGKLALGSGKLGIGTLIGGTSLIAGALTAEQEEEAQQISDETGIPIETIRANPNEYLARRFNMMGDSEIEAFKIDSI